VIALPSTTMTSSDDVSTIFPHPNLTAVKPGELPTHVSLAVLHQELNTNAMSIPSHRGGGAYGHLTLCIPPAAYAILPNAVPFVAPHHPGANPVHPANATAPQITEINRAYLADLEEYKLYSATDHQLKKLLLAAIPITFVQALANPTLGFATSTTLDILTHLDTTYGTVDADALATNLATLDKPWSPDQPIEDLWNQLRDAQLFAADVDPISDRTAVNAAVKLLEATGQFSLALREWRQKTLDQMTLATMKTHFDQANKERLRSTTTSQAGFAVVPASTIPASTAPPSTKPAKNPFDGWHYCWSHGLNKTHTGVDCKNPKEGHKTTATINNLQAGASYISKPRPPQRQQT
jgi:hypothetical protein